MGDSKTQPEKNDRHFGKENINQLTQFPTSPQTTFPVTLSRATSEMGLPKRVSRTFQSPVLRDFRKEIVLTPFSSPLPPLTSPSTSVEDIDELPPLASFDSNTNTATPRKQPDKSSSLSDFSNPPSPSTSIPTTNNNFEHACHPECCNIISPELRLKIFRQSHASRVASRSASNTLSGDEFEAISALFDLCASSNDNAQQTTITTKNGKTPPTFSFLFCASQELLSFARVLSRTSRVDLNSRTFLRQLAMRLEMGGGANKWDFVQFQGVVVEARSMTHVMIQDNAWSCANALIAFDQAIQTANTGITSNQLQMSEASTSPFQFSYASLRSPSM